MSDAKMQQNVPLEECERLRQQSATAILRVFNYYRVGLAFALLLIFIQLQDQQFVGALFPDLFRAGVLAYTGLNVFISLLTLLMNQSQVARKPYLCAVLSLDVMLLCLLMYASGGVSSGLGNFLIFPVAFAGVLIYGRFSMVFAAVSILLVFYLESHLMMRSGEVDEHTLFRAGLLGIALFAVNLLFQHISRRLRRREAEVTTLQHLDQMRSLAEITQQELEQSNALFEVLLNSAGQGVLGLDLTGRITFANPKAAEILVHEKLTGLHITDVALLDDESGSSFQTSNVLHSLDIASQAVNTTTYWMSGNAKKFPVDYSCEATYDKQGELTGAVVIFQDVTERHNAENELHRLANFDPLTGLANRTLFQQDLETGVRKASNEGTSFAVLLLDLDHFKCVNDQLGHDYGDELLIAASKRMRNCIREGDTVARLGGDEFAILVSGFASKDNLSIIAQNLVDQVSRPYGIFEQQVRISTSIGIAVFGEHQHEVDKMLKCADIALYAAKADGRSCFHYHSLEMHEEAEASRRIQLALQNAIEQEDFQVHFQPIVALDDHSLHHCEALIRWQPRGEDPISPDIFIPIAEDTGKIGQIGLWVFRKVLVQLTEWHARHGVMPKVAVNVSTKQLATSFFRENVASLMQKYEVPAEHIEIELTETGSMDNPDFVVAELSALKEMGFTICADDFGTGHSSLDYLRLLPIDQLKIDKCFIRGIGVSRQDEEIVKVVLAIAKVMDLTVVAEGIENEMQIDFLKRLGCDLGQGYLFARPVDAIAMDQYLHGGPLFPRAGKVSYLQPSSQVGR